MKVLTISIAAYNVEKYLETALDSICKSSVLDDVEIIIVDDGSKDKTGEIGASYSEKYPQSIKCISKINAGHGSTINVGLSEAHGKYFRVLDGDDWIDTEGFSRFVTKLKLIDTDLVISDKKLAYPDHEEMVKFDYLKEKHTYKISTKYPYDICTLSTMTIKTDILRKNNVKITENSFYVDIEYVVSSMLLSKTFSYISENVYMYRRGMDEQSISKKSMLKNVKMLEKITFGLYTLIDQYEVAADSKDFAYKRIEQSTGALYRTYFLMNDSKESRDSVIKFETYIKKKHPNGFNKIQEDKFIKVIRCGNYLFLPMVRNIYRIWCKKKKLI